MPDGRADSRTEGIAVEVAYARPEAQVLLGLKLPEGSTVGQAIEASGILALFPEIDPMVNKVGIFGSVCELDHPLKPHDRVEIYRPLPHDPKDTRRLRAMKK